MEEKQNKAHLEINIRKLFNELWINRKTIYKATAVLLILGLIVGFSIPKEYTCIVKMAPEGTKSSITGNVSDLAAIAGINLGTGEEDGIGLALYPDVVQSMPFITELINIQISDVKMEQGSNLYDYLDKKVRYPWWRSVFTFPFELIDRIREGKDAGSEIEINPYRLTRSQDRVFEKLKKRITVSIDKKTGVITSWVTMQDPAIAAVVADSLITNLERFIIDYRTSKAKQDFDFALKMFTESKQKYYSAQQNYARYIDRNKNVVLEYVLIEQERLKNEQSIAYNVYSTLAQQVEKARLKVQEQTPCITVLEPARVPVRKSNTSKLTILMLFGFLGALGGAIKVVYLNWHKLLNNWFD